MFSTVSSSKNPNKSDHPTTENFSLSAHTRNYGIILGVLTAVYLVVLNIIYAEVPLGLRFAKHLIIIPVVWMAVADYAKRLPEGKVFKAEIGYLLRVAGWSALALAVINALFFMVTAGSFEQFMQEGETFAGMMINSGFLFFETVVFVMIIGLVVLQGYKSGGSPEDPS